jgi:hypothetical protein
VRISRGREVAMTAIRFLALALAMAATGCEHSGEPMNGGGSMPVGPSPVVAKDGSPSTIKVVSGQLAFDPPSGVLDLKGSAGFAMSSRVSVAGGIFDPFNQCRSTLDCVPGTEVSLRAHWSGSDLPATGTIRGQAYRTGISPMSPYALIEFTGKVVLPAFTEDGTLEISAPFTVTGRFHHFSHNQQPGVTEIINGQGVARLYFQRDRWTASAWVFQTAVYEIHPSAR